MQAGTLDKKASPERCCGPQKARSGRGSVAAATAVLLLALSSPAHAVDGCLVLLCLAAPNWSAIAQCVAPVTQVLRDLARGRPFPTCGMAGAGNSASHQWSSAPGYCPPQYVSSMELENTVAYGCDFIGAVTVNIEGSLWSRTWWNMGGQTVTEFSPAAKASMGSWDMRFDDDHARWLASRPAPAEPCLTC